MLKMREIFSKSWSNTIRFRKIAHYACLAPMVLLLCSCGLVNNYRPNPDSPHAKLGFYQNTLGKNENAGLIFSNYKTCTQGINIPMLSSPFTIDAGQPTTLMVQHIVGYTKLYFAFTFIPKKDHTYLIATKTQKHKREITTILQLKQIKPGQSTFSNVAIIPRHYKIGAFSASCTDSKINMNKARKVYSMKKTAKQTKDIIFIST